MSIRALCKIKMWRERRIDQLSRGAKRPTKSEAHLEQVPRRPLTVPTLVLRETLASALFTFHTLNGDKAVFKVRL